jgi:hypothetical protein
MAVGDGDGNGNADAGVQQEMMAWFHGNVSADSGSDSGYLEQTNDLKTAQA